MTLPDRIIDYILRVNGQVTMDKLVAKTTAAGFSELEVLTALEYVHCDKRIQVRNLKTGVTYSPAREKPAPAKLPNPWTPELWAYSDELTKDGTPIPFYCPEQDGPSPVYGPEYSQHLREKNKALKRQVEKGVYNRGNGKQGKRSTKVNT